MVVEVYWAYSTPGCNTLLSKLSKTAEGSQIQTTFFFEFCYKGRKHLPLWKETQKFSRKHIVNEQTKTKTKFSFEIRA